MLTKQKLTRLAFQIVAFLVTICIAIHVFVEMLADNEVHIIIKKFEEAYQDGTIQRLRASEYKQIPLFCNQKSAVAQDQRFIVQTFQSSGGNIYIYGDRESLSCVAYSYVNYDYQVSKFVVVDASKLAACFQALAVPRVPVGETKPTIP